MAVRERVREVAVLKTLGFTPGNILGLLVCEALVISFVGGLLGMGLAALVCATLRRGPSFGADLSQLMVAPSIVVMGLGISLLIGFISALIPAYVAARRPILDSLRVNH